MLKKIRIAIKQKGQGIIEYAVLLAFIVGLAVMLLDGGLSFQVKDTIDDVIVLLRGDKYAPYFQNWRDKSAAWLHENTTPEERLDADKEALAKLARAFIGLTEDKVGELIASYSVNRNNKVQFDNDKNYKEGQDGWSNVLVPLSYNKNGLDDATGNYITLDYNGHVEAIKVLSNDAKAYIGKDPNNHYHDNDAALGDRIFYSDGMILGENANANTDDKRMVTMQVHYNNGVVDQVKIQARTSNSKTSAVVSGLDLNVTKTEIRDAGN